MKKQLSEIAVGIIDPKRFKDAKREKKYFRIPGRDEIIEKETAIVRETKLIERYEKE